MAVIFFLMFFVTLIALVWGLLAPKSLANRFKLKSYSRKNLGLIFGLLSFIFLVMVGITAPKQPVKPQNIQLTTSSHNAPSPNITTKTAVQTKAIPFTSSTVQDATLAQGTTKVTTTGVNGVETLTYQDTYTNGKQTSQKLLSDITTTQPINQVTSIGTYVAPTTPTGCTNGTYVNSAGNTVCSPETSSTVPAGATAQCVDGTYSFSQSRSGTCSHHGGVAQWL